MNLRMFAAIDVGSYELEMKIFQFTQKGGMKEIDCIKHRIELGTDTYATGKISYGRVDELCEVIKHFQMIMKQYQIQEYKAYGTSAIRETENTLIVLDQIRVRTGLVIDVLSNSEQRFLDYKSIASKGVGFNKIIEKGSAIVDIGGGSIQVSLFDNDSLVTTQNMKLGVLRMRDKLESLQPKRSQYETLIEEMINNQLSNFKKMYLKDRKIENIIIVDDYVSFVIQKGMENSEHPGYINRKQFLKFMEIIRSKTATEVAGTLGIPGEHSTLLFQSAILIKRLMEVMDAELLWAPGVTLCDGIAYEYAEKNKIAVSNHDFEKDILACAANISKRYMGSKRRGEMLEMISVTIFDSIKKIHGLGKREQLLLRLSALLHDCGKYVSLVNPGESSYEIIMATEIIGLSHVEREIVANIVKYNHVEFDYYEELGRKTMLDKASYLTIAKLTAILRVANGLDRSNKQKFKDIKTMLRDRQLIITVDTQEDITLERGLLTAKADFFEEVYSIRPVIRQKRRVL